MPICCLLRVAGVNPAGARQPDLATAIAAADRDRIAVREQLVGRRADLPLRYWRQQAHYTTPASDPALARKAVEGATSSVPRTLDRLGLSATDLAEHLELSVEAIESRLAAPMRAPLVMIDGEDAIAPGDDVAARAIAIAADTFVNADWGDSSGLASLRFYRPSGLNLDTTVRDLYSLLWRLHDLKTGASLPLDGIIFPKVEHPEEVDLVNDLLDRAERLLGLPEGQIRVGYLIESGWGAAQLPDIATRAAPRLASLIFGLADYCADLGLPVIANDHPLVDWARAEIIAVAGAVGVPAIDGMTLDYPVIEPTADLATNRVRWLDRVRLVYHEAVRARELGMLGKWVGHPAQLFGVLLAYDSGLTAAALDKEAAKLEAYRAATAADQGATLIGGVMSDRATDRHARVVLRQATAMGRFDPTRALALGVISAAEVPEASRAHATSQWDAGA
jgi:citrate lyase subunit beta/citryl-CoA lyase